MLSAQVPDPGTLAQALGLLGCDVTVPAASPAEVRALHLSRLLAGAAEQHAVAAEHAVATTHGGQFPGTLGTGDHQGSYDLATAAGALSMLAVTYWRSQRLSAGVQALADALTGADDGTGAGEPDSPAELIWDLAVPAVAAGEGLLGFLAGVTVGGDPGGTAGSLDAATALLASAGRRASQLRRRIGLDPVPDLAGEGPGAW